MKTMMKAIFPKSYIKIIEISVRHTVQIIGINIVKKPNITKYPTTNLSEFSNGPYTGEISSEMLLIMKFKFMDLILLERLLIYAYKV